LEIISTWKGKEKIEVKRVKWTRDEKKGKGGVWRIQGGNINFGGRGIVLGPMTGFQ
jgi:hypothetical protein